MYVTIVHVKVKPEHLEDFIRASESNHHLSVKEPGNLRFDILQKGEDPCEFALYEAYENKETVAPWMAEPRMGVQYEGLLP